MLGLGIFRSLAANMRFPFDRFTLRFIHGGGKWGERASSLLGLTKPWRMSPWILHGRLKSRLGPKPDDVISCNIVVKHEKRCPKLSPRNTASRDLLLMSWTWSVINLILTRRALAHKNGKLKIRGVKRRKAES